VGHLMHNSIPHLKWFRLPLIILRNTQLMFVALSLLLLATFSNAADSDSDSPYDVIADSLAVKRPKVAVALSGGGARGLAHVGVLKVIEEAGLHVDIVTGTSMGAIVGGLYAMNKSAQDLERLALETDWMLALTDTPFRSDLAMEQKNFDGIYMLSLPFVDGMISLPGGIIRGQRISKLLSGLTWPVQSIDDFTQFPRPFACVATDLETGEAFVMTGGDLAESIRASMAIPSIFTPVRLENRLLVDGFVARNLPVEDALNLGADFVIAVDVGEPQLAADSIQSLVDIINQTMNYGNAIENSRQRAMADIMIVPNLKQYSFLAFTEVKELIQRGEDAARPFFDQFKALADSLNAIAPVPRLYYPISADSIFINEISVLGLERSLRSTVLGAFGHRTASWISRTELESGIDRVFGTGHYESVTYLLKPDEGGTKLVIKVIERRNSEVRFGFHFDTDDKSAVQFAFATYNWLLPGTYADFSLKLGNTTGWDGVYFLGAGRETRIGIKLNVGASQKGYLYDSSDNVTQSIDQHEAHMDFFLGTLFSTRLALGGGNLLTYVNHTVGNQESVENGLGIGYLLLQYDSLNRLYFSTLGASLVVRYLSSYYHPYEEDAYYRGVDFKYSVNFPLSSTATLRVRGIAGAKEKLNFLPTPSYIIGGYEDLYGVAYNSLSGNYLQSVRASLQLEPWEQRFFVLEVDAGRVTDEWIWELNDREVVMGWAATFGLLTPFGPISASYYRGSSNQGATHLRIGYMF